MINALKSSVDLVMEKVKSVSDQIERNHCCKYKINGKVYDCVYWWGKRYAYDTQKISPCIVLVPCSLSMSHWKGMVHIKNYGKFIRKRKEAGVVTENHKKAIYSQYNKWVYEKIFEYSFMYR